jgi:Peroxidase, family 2
MKYALTLAAMAIAIGDVTAFPALAMENMDKLSKKSDTKEKRVLGVAGFDAKSQFVSNTGTHAFVAPNFAKGDLRGPCPGLNAMANHGYLPHNGWASIEQFVEGTFTVFGMGAVRLSYSIFCCRSTSAPTSSYPYSKLHC